MQLSHGNKRKENPYQTNYAIKACKFSSAKNPVTPLMVKFKNLKTC